MLLKNITDSVFIGKKILHHKDDILSKLISRFNVIPMGFLRTLNNSDAFEKKNKKRF